MRVVFTVQGEGRGHLSQALALRALLAGRGHEVVGLFVGTSQHRSLPAYFARGMELEPVAFPSPTTVPGPRRRGVSVLRTGVHNLPRIPRYLAARGWLRREVAALRPDLVVNFYDALAGLALSRLQVEGRRIPLVSVGHQYLLSHPQAPRPPFRPLQLGVFRLMNRLSAPRGVRRLALSFRDLPDGPGPSTRVVPPLLRPQVRSLAPEPGAHLLVYVLNAGYARDVARWQAGHPEVEVHAFADRPEAPPEEVMQPGLTFHRLDDARFLERMRSCRGFVGTAGFESVAEALWLGKPVFVVPTGNQVEQAWNAREAEAARAGMASDRFNLDAFLAFLDGRGEGGKGARPDQGEAAAPLPPPTEVYRRWVEAGEGRLLHLLEEAARGGTAA